MGKSSKGVKCGFNPNNFSTVALLSQNRKIPVNKVKYENTRNVAAVRERRRYCDFIAVTLTSLIVVGIAVFVVTYQQMLNGASNLMSQNCNKLVVFIHSNETSKAIRQVCESLDYAIVHDANENWNIFWSTRDPFELFPDHMTKLKPHQLVNHINHHSMLVASRAFQLPNMKRKLMDYETKNPQTRFIIKDCLLDGVKFDINNIDLSYDANFAVHALDECSLQIDGHNVYFGIFFLISSVEPLRVYRFKGVTVRFIREFQKNGKFVCLEFLSPLDTPSLKKYSGYLTKHAIEGYLSENGINFTLVDHKIDEEFVKFLVPRIKKVKKMSNNFMQLLRVDFSLKNESVIKIIDIDPLIDFDGNEQLMYEVLRLVGGINLYEFKCRASLQCPMLSTSKDIVVANADICLNSCNKSCSLAECELCLSCLMQVPVSLNHLHRSYREQMRCNDNMKRIFPKHYDDSLVNQLSPMNRLSVKWFQAKCDAEGGVWC